jgi:diguanylate cyclase (GGDEF)-like protein
MGSKGLFQLVILFMMASIIAFISVKHVWTVDATMPKKREVVYSYKGPDGTSWTHGNRNAIERLKEHYSLNSAKVFNRMEAEREPIKKTFMETTVTLPSSRFWDSVWRDIVIGACTLVLGFLSIYALRSSGGATPSGREGQKTRPRTHDSGSVTPDSSDLSTKLKTIVAELLHQLVSFSQENPDLRSERFKELIDEYVAKLETALPPDELDIIERELKKLVAQEWNLIKSLIKGRDKELKAIVASLVGSMDFFSKDNTKFSLNINKNLTNIEKILTLDEIKEIRGKITGEISHAREVIEEKRKDDSKKIEELSLTVKSLDRELSEVKEEAQHDGLTRLYNRKTFDRRIVEKIDRSKIRGTTFTLALIDIDYFKRINDSFGHSVGDEVLRNVSAYLKKYLGKGDFIARFGGEEFAVILDEGNRVLVQKVLESLRENISKHKFNAGEEKVSVTVSIGIAFCKWHDSVDSLIKRADKLLYSAKKAGRNKSITEDSL